MKIILRATVIAATVLVSRPSLAEVPPDSSVSAQGSETLAEVVVTAQKRSESVLSTPVSVTVLGAEDLKRLAPRNATDLVAQVPALQVNTPTGNEAPVFSLRGISQNDYSALQSGPIAVYTDEIYRSGFTFFSDQLYDLERVEVLRGPQGTLYGRNATGGAINFVAAKPGPETGGYVTLSAGNYGTYHADGAAQTGLADGLSGRLAFTVTRSDGWQKNIVSGGQDLGEQRDYGLRLTLKYAGNGPVEALLQLATSATGPNSTPNIAQPYPAGIGGGIYDYFHTLYPASNPKTDYFPAFDWKHTAVAGAPLRTDTASHDAALHVTWHANPLLELSSITGFSKGHYWFYEPNASNAPLQVLGDNLLYEGDQFSQEFRLTTSDEKPVSAIAGAIYSRDRLLANTDFSYYTDIDFNGDGKINSADCLSNLNPAQLLYPYGCVQNNRLRQTRESQAVYADAAAKLGSFKLHIGARYTHDRLIVDDYSAWTSGSDGTPLFNTIPGDPVNVFASEPRISKTYSKPTGRIGLDYTFDNGTLLYANASRGYRTGAVNAAAYNSLTELTFAAPEVLDAAEIGVKGAYWERRIQLSVSAFYYAYKNQQALNVDPATFLQSIVNIDRSRIEGMEVEVVARPISPLTLRLGLSALSSRVEEGTLGGASLVGNQLPLAPKWSGSASVDWAAFHVDAGQINLFSAIRYTDHQFSDLFSDPNAAFSSYAVVDGRAQFAFAGIPLAIGVYGKNLADKFYYQNRFDLASFGYIYNHVGTPRTFGVDATYSFR